GLVYLLELGVQGADRGHGRAQDQRDWLVEHAVEPVGVACRPREGGGDLSRVSEAAPALLLDEGGQVLQRHLDQVLRREMLQHRHAGGTEGVAKGLLLAKGAELEEQEAQEVVLLARQRLGQMCPEARQALQRRVENVYL